MLMKTAFHGALCGAMLLALHQAGTSAGLPAQALKRFTPYSDAKPIFDSLRPDLLPVELRDPATRERRWAEWVMGHDAVIRARVEGGEEDSIVYLLLFGTSFTKAPRASEKDLAGLVVTPDEALRRLGPRIDDFAAALASPGTNERLQFARRIIERKGFDPVTQAGRADLRRYLEGRTRLVGGSIQSSRPLDPATDASDKMTLFRERGLSTDTSVFIDFGVEQALDAMKTAGSLRAGSVRRVAIIGPGLDFTDKLDGYDFYPEQTIQPFALIDSLLRLELATSADVAMMAFDVSPKVVDHLAAARSRARAGAPYPVVLPRNTDRPWSSDLVDYWQRLGNWVGETTPKVPAPPASAGRVDVRGISIRPEIVLTVTPADLNVVTEGLDASGGSPFDLIVATNILLYYNVFEQSLAAANIARMLRPGGILLTNNRIFELPASPLEGVGYTDVVYMSLPGVGDAGDRMVWYQKQ
ncbi:MAG TPA: class I SAM-dependent methyltransferase [Vicinamibacterales bacterium]